MLAARAVGQPLNRYSVQSSVSDCRRQFASWVEFLRCWVIFPTELIICKMTFVVFLLIGWFVYWQFIIIFIMDDVGKKCLIDIKEFFCLGPLFTVVVLVANIKIKWEWICSNIRIAQFLAIIIFNCTYCYDHFLNCKQAVWKAFLVLPSFIGPTTFSRLFNSHEKNVDTLS